MEVGGKKGRKDLEHGPVPDWTSHCQPPKDSTGAGNSWREKAERNGTWKGEGILSTHIGRGWGDAA